MAKIRIVKVPPGFAPEHIRREWLGVEIPLPTQAELAENPPSAWEANEANSGGYIVFQDDAVKALLAAEKNGAAEFWEDLELPAPYLRFRRDCCEVIS